VFYLLFSPDAWRLCMGLLLAWLAVPYLLKPEMTGVTRGLLFLMVTAIGWTITATPGRWIAGKLQRLVPRR
jgi:hypothetical protein